MHAFIVNGSPRRAGSTGVLCEQFAQGVRDAGGKASVICLGELTVGYCKGCNGCRETGECVIHDDMQDLVRQILACDVLVLASPSYWGDVTAQMKTFIDRSCPLCEYVTKKRIGEGKKGVSIVVRAGVRKEESMHLVQCFEHYFGHLGITPAERLTFEEVSSPEQLTTQKAALAYSLGRRTAK